LFLLQLAPVSPSIIYYYYYAETRSGPSRAGRLSPLPWRSSAHGTRSGRDRTGGHF